MASYIQKGLDFLAINILPFVYLFAGIYIGVIQGLLHAVTEAWHAMPAEVQSTWTNVVKRSKVIIDNIEGRVFAAKHKSTRMTINGKATATTPAADEPVKAAKIEVVSARKRVDVALNGKSINRVFVNGQHVKA